MFSFVFVSAFVLALVSEFAVVVPFVFVLVFMFGCRQGIYTSVYTYTHTNQYITCTSTFIGWAG